LVGEAGKFAYMNISGDKNAIICDPDIVSYQVGIRSDCRLTYVFNKHLYQSK